MKDRALIIGAGVSGLGAAKYLIKKGWDVALSERSVLSDDTKQPFLNLGVSIADGGHHESHLNNITLVVLSPGLPSTHPLIIGAKARNISVVSEIDLGLGGFDGTLIGVTGTNGKSTTCAMIWHMLNTAGHQSSIGGNFGDPPTAILAENRMRSYLVLELSSYQLEQSKPIKPKVAIFTSFSFDHLARHGSITGYLAAKWRIFEDMEDGSLAIIPKDIIKLAREHGLSDIPPHVKVQSVEVDDLARDSLIKMGISESHNQLNALVSYYTVKHLIGKKARLELLNNFKGLPHRCELVGTFGRVRVINDSKSTNVESTLSALQNLKPGVLLLMGGQGKGEPYLEIASMKDKIALLVTFGASGNIINSELGSTLKTKNYATLKTALENLPSLITTDISTILFSPGCASFDEFKNFEHRGTFFTEKITTLLGARDWAKLP